MNESRAPALDRNGRVLGAVLLVVSFVYGLASLVFSAWGTGVTMDEPTYTGASMAYLGNSDFSGHTGHPALSNMIGGLLWRLTGHDDLIYFRLPHVALFTLAGLFVAWRLWQRVSPLAAVLFALLYNFCPNLKAMASLHVVIADASTFVVLSAVIAALPPPNEKNPRVRIFWASFFAACGVLSNFSMLFFLPVLVWSWVKEFGFNRFLKRMIPWVIASAIMAFLISYRFEVAAGLRNFFEAFVFQRGHNKSGHVTYLLGRRSGRGFWYFYPISYLFKAPLAQLALVGGACVAVSRDRKKHLLEWNMFFLPAFLLLALLSMARVQLGLRYALASIELSLVGSAIVVSKYLPSEFFEKWRRCVRLPGVGSFLWIIFALLLASDATNLASGDYISYFNALAPRPRTRWFAESNIDWNQGLPRHLTRLRAEYVSAQSLGEDPLATGQSRYRIAAGASQIEGIFGPSWATRLKPLDPVMRVGSVELFDLSRDQLTKALK